jgi:hypothetical protein
VGPNLSHFFNSEQEGSEDFAPRQRLCQLGYQIFFDLRISEHNYCFFNSNLRITFLNKTEKYKPDIEISKHSSIFFEI